MPYPDEPMENDTCDCLISEMGSTHNYKEHTDCGGMLGGPTLPCGGCHSCLSAQIYWSASDGYKKSPAEVDEILKTITCQYGGQCEPGQCTGPCGNQVPQEAM